MRPEDLLPEQRKDIEERVAKAKTMLEELQLTPQASVAAINTGDDTFSMKVVVYLSDQKYLSSISKNDIEAT